MEIFFIIMILFGAGYLGISYKSLKDKHVLNTPPNIVWDGRKLKLASSLLACAGGLLLLGGLLGLLTNVAEIGFIAVGLQTIISIIVYSYMPDR